MCGTLILFNGLYFSFKLNFVQIKIFKFFSILRHNKKLTISSKDTLIISLASKIGIGSIAGTALAIYYGGIGTVFWIWLIAFFASVNCFLENFLATKYQYNENKCKVGGPSFYIKKGLNNNVLSFIFSLIAIITYIFCFMTIQNNTVSFLFNDMFHVPAALSSLFITALFILCISKGINGISNICKKIVPIMSIIYIFIGLIITIFNFNSINKFFIDVLYYAFNPKSVNGSILYILIFSLKREIFATEAGMGTSSSISGASYDTPTNEGYSGILSTYFICFIVITITAFIIHSANIYNINISNGIEIARLAFHYHLGLFGDIILLIILFLFAFSSIITAFYYGESNLKNIIVSKNIFVIFKIFVIVILFIGGVVKSSFIWNISDLFIAILTIINLVSIFRLRKVIISDYYKYK